MSLYKEYTLMQRHFFISMDSNATRKELMLMPLGFFIKHTF